MRGMLEKDIRLMKGQKQFLLIVFIMLAMLLLSEKGMNFAVTYCVLICVIHTIGTISYDEFDNGYGFLFTLPVSRRGYALEKYLLAFLTGGMVLLAVSVIGAVLVLVRGYEAGIGAWLANCGMALLLMLMTMALMIPIQLKYGQEKARIMTVVVFALIGAALGIMDVVKKQLHFVTGNLAGIHPGVLVLAGCLAVFGITAASVWYSVRVMEKKEF